MTEPPAILFPWGDRRPTVGEWTDWLDSADPEQIPPGQVRDFVLHHREAREFWARWNPYGLFDRGIDLDDELPPPPLSGENSSEDEGN